MSINFTVIVVSFVAAVSGLRLTTDPTSNNIAFAASPTIKDPKISSATLPADIVKLGVRVFGSEENLNKALKKTNEMSVQMSGVMVRLMASSADNTLPRLAHEMGMKWKDRYGLQKVTAKQGVIIDVGSNIGDISIAAALLHPTLQIIAVEPSPHTYFYLVLNLWLNKVPKLSENDLGKYEKAGVVALNAAVTKDGRSVEIKWSDSNSQNAAVGTTEAKTNGWSSANVPSIQLTKFLANHNLDAVELLKIDCEGCEFEVIPSMKAVFADKAKIKRVTGEIHQSLKNPKAGTEARKATPDEIKFTDAALADRGCKINSWEVEC